MFISDRREDASYIAGRLHDALAAHLPDESIFRDVDDIRPGVDFVDEIEHTVGSCHALVALIGEEWLNAQDSSGSRRIDNQDDWVRLEIATALDRDILVVPVLVESAGMPSEPDLPSELRRLARRNAMRLTDERWDYDVGVLAEALGVTAKRRRPLPENGHAPGSRSAEPLPLPALLLRTGTLPMVGRRGELSKLAAAVEEAAGGRRRAVLVLGEPGSGKTRLVCEAAREAHSKGALVLAGRCDDGLAVPYQPFLEALRHFVDHSDEKELRDRLGRSPGELARLLPEIGARLPRLPPPSSAEPDTERYRLFEAVASWLATASADGPLLLVVDDLQWASKPTVLLLRYVLRSSESMRVLVLATYRDTEVPVGSPLAELLTDLQGDAAVEQLPLDGLDVDEVRELATAATSGRLRAATSWAEPIRADTKGNPFFVAELARYVVETDPRHGLLRVPSSVLQLGIPEGVHQLVSRRWSRLGEATQAALTTASVAGLEFDPMVVRRASRLEEDAMVCALEEAMAARVVEELPSAAACYRFSHALLRASLYEHASRLRRVVLHRRVGEAIEALYGSDRTDLLPELAQHFGLAADGGPNVKAASYSRRAGDHALLQLANDEAVGHYRTALGLTDSRTTVGLQAEEYCEILLSLGEAEARAGDPGYRETLLDAAERARRLGDRERLARAALSLTRGRSNAAGEVDRERVRVLQAALDAFPRDDSAVRARLLAYQGVELTWSGEWHARVALSDEAVAMARRVGDPATLTLVLHLRFMTLWAASTLAERLVLVAEAQTLAADLDDRVLEFHARYSACYAAMETGDLGSADRLLASMRLLSQQLRQPLLEWRVLYTRGTLATIAGDFQQGERLAFEALAVGQTAGQPDATGAFTIQIFTLRLHQGRLGELVTAAETGFVEATDTGSLPWAAQMALAVVYRELDRREDARRVLETVMADDLRDVPDDYGWLPTVAFGAHVCSYLRDGRASQRLYQLLAPYEAQCICLGPSWFGSTAHYLALTAAALGKLEEADRHFATALDAHTKAASPVWQAHTRLAWGEMLLESAASDDSDRGRSLVADAGATAKRLGMVRIEQRAAELLGG